MEYNIIIDNKENALNDANKQIKDCFLISPEEVIYINLFLKVEFSSNELRILLVSLMNENKIIVNKIEYNKENTNIIIFGDVNNITIYTNKNIKILGKCNCNIFSSKDIEVYANEFINCNIIKNDDHFFIENKKNYLFKTNSF